MKKVTLLSAVLTLTILLSAFTLNCGDDEDGKVTGIRYAYVADSDEGLAVIDVSDPTDPGDPVYQETSNESSGVYVTDGYAYLALRIGEGQTLNSKFIL